MFPFINFFGKTIPSYGLLILIGSAVSILVSVYFPYRKSLKRDDILYASLFAASGVLVGAKIFYIVGVIPLIMQKGLSFFEGASLIVKTFGQGFVFYGGLIGATVSVFLYCKVFKVSFFSIIETLIVIAPLVHAFGRLGCFAAGCCYGIPFESPFSVVFPAHTFGLAGVPLFPVQLLEAAVNFLIFAILFLLSRKPRRTGQLLGLYLFLYSISRFLLEFLRGDSVRGSFGVLSTSQWIGVLLLPIALFLLFSKTLEKLFPFTDSFAVDQSVSTPPVETD